MKEIKINDEIYVLKSEAVKDSLDKLDSLKEEMKETSREDLIVDSCNIMAMVKPIEEKGTFKVYLKKGSIWEYPIQKSKLIVDLENKGTIRCEVGEIYSLISEEYYTKAKKINKLLGGSDKCFKVYLQDTSKQPVLMTGGNVGFVLAPRIDSEDEDD